MERGARSRADVQRLWRLVLVPMLALALGLAGLPAFTPATRAASTDIVISQVYGGGGNTGAQYTTDFIELFNRDTAPVDVSTWSVQYGSAAGAFSGLTRLTGVIQPGHYYLVSQATGPSGAALPPADTANTGVNLSATNGKVALVTNQTLLTCGATAGNCFPNAAIEDFVGFGSATNFEGIAAAPVGSNTTAITRMNTCADADANSTDFAASAPNPRNSATAAAPCKPLGTGTATPASVRPGDAVLLTVAVTPAANPTSTGLTVTGDLASIGGSATQAFSDDGTNGDAIAGDNTFSYRLNVSNSTGDKSLPITIGDTQARSSATTIALTVATTLLTVVVTPGSTPTSTGLTVTGDLTGIGGPATQAFFDDGTNGDATAGDNTFSFSATVGAGAAAGQKSLPVTIADTQSRTSNTTIAFTVIPPRTYIHTIQGTAHLSPFNGQPAMNVRGIVTTIRSYSTTIRGFYMQEADADADSDPATSEAIFVNTGSTTPTVTVGDRVTVSGTVGEYRPGNTATNLTITEIVTPTIVGSAPNVALPTATTIGSGGRVPPTTAIRADTPGNVEASATFDAVNNGLDFYESLEGMRVQINNAVATGPTQSFGSNPGNREISVLADGGAGDGPRTARGGIRVQPGDFNPERVILNDIATSVLPTPITLPAVNVGATFTGTIVGYLDYSFGNYKLQITAAPPTPTASPIARETTGLTHDAANQLTVATFNVQNLTVGDPQSKYDALAQIIIGRLGAPDIVALEEIQDNNGVADDGTVAADQTYAKLIAAITSASGPTYQYRQIDPVADRDGGAPGGNIRVGFLFRTDRGLAFVDRAGGCPTCGVGITGSGPDTRLTTSPGRIEPLDPAFSSSRKPLAGEFTFNGRTFFVIANHFNSKGGDEPLFGPYQPPLLVSQNQRDQQAQIVNAFVGQLVSADPQAAAVVLGDFNDFEFSEPLGILKGTVLTDLVEMLPENERYTYVFSGNSQVLDHMLVTPGFASQFAAGGVGGYDIVHVNSEFVDQTSDHEPQVARFVVNPRLVAGAVTTNTPENTPVTIALTATGGAGTPTFTIVTPPAHGTLGAINGAQVTYTPAANYSGPDSFTYRASDGTQLSDPATATIAVATVNAAPVATNSSVTTPANVGLTIILGATDSDSATLTYSIVTPPAHGTLGAGGGNQVTYIPARDYSGPDAFTFRASDGTANSNVATVSIAVTPDSAVTYTLTTSATGNGTVTPATGAINAGTAVALTTTPGAGATFIGWTIDGAFAGLANPLTIAMNGNHTAVAAFAPLPSFTDVPTGTPYRDAILRLAARGIIKGFGDGTFGPTQPIKRAESAALIARAMGWDGEDHGNGFIDRCDPTVPTNCIDVDLWRNVGTLAFYDVARGFPGRGYRPRDEVAHVQVISFVTRAMVAKGYWTQARADDPSVYPNVLADSGHRLDLVTFVRNAGAIPDRPINQNWDDWTGTASRGWYAAVLDQALRSRFVTTP